MSIRDKPHKINLFYINGGYTPKAKKGKSRQTVTDPPIPSRSWWDIILEQLTNAAVVGVMAFVSTIIASDDWALTWKAGLIAAGLAFLVEMRKYWPRKTGG